LVFDWVVGDRETYLYEYYTSLCENYVEVTVTLTVTVIYGDLRKVSFVLIWFCSLVFDWFAFAFDQLSTFHSTIQYTMRIFILLCLMGVGVGVVCEFFRELYNKRFIYRSAYVYIAN